MGEKEKKRPTLPFKKIAVLVLKISRRLVEILRRLVEILRRLVKKRLDLFQKTSGFFFGSSFALVPTSDFGDFCQVIPPLCHPLQTRKKVSTRDTFIESSVSPFGYSDKVYYFSIPLTSSLVNLEILSRIAVSPFKFSNL